MASLFKNIITFGAAGRIDSEIAVYERFKKELETVHKEMEQKRIKVNNTLIQVVKNKKKAVRSLKKIQKITKNLKSKDRIINDIQIQDEKKLISNLEYVENSISLADVAISSSKGVGAGLATASSAYFLVGQFATASTGTAISALSGAAATNATLAWLGGGSIAAGGGGIAAGSMVMGGIVALPALAVMGIFSHISANKKIKEIEEKEIEILKTTRIVKDNILAFDLLHKRAVEIDKAVNKAKEVFDIEFKKVYKNLYRIPVLSKLIKNFRKIIGKNYFNEKDLKHIQYIGEIAMSFAKIIDSKVIEEKG